MQGKSSSFDHKRHKQIPNKTQLLPLDADKVEVWYDDAAIFTRRARLWYIYTSPQGKKVRFADDEILHLRSSMSFDGILGVPVCETLSGNIDSMLEAQRAQNDIYI